MSKGFKSFFITFLLSCVLFAYGASYIFENHIDRFIETLFGIAQSEQSEVSDDFSQTISRPDESDTSISDESIGVEYKGTSKGSLFILKNEKGEVDTVLIMRRKLETKDLLVTMVPADTRLYVDGAYQKVRNLLKNRDIEFFKAKMEAIVGVTLDYYFVMEYEDFEPVFTEFNGYSYTIPYDMYLDTPFDESDVSGDLSDIIVDESNVDESLVPMVDSSDIIVEIPDESGALLPSTNIIVDLKAGRTELTADIFRQLTIFRRYNEEKEHTALMKDLFTSVFVQMFSESNGEELRKDIELVLPILDTNFTMEEYDANVDAILGYSEYTKHILDYPGSYKKMADGSIQFNPEVEKAIIMFKDYR